MLGIIVFGTKGREKAVETGAFTCPSCRSQQRYERRQAKRWFTLYFLPVIPLDSMGEWIHCSGCGGDFETGVLSVTPEQVQAANAPWSCTACGNVNGAAERACLGCGASR